MQIYFYINSLFPSRLVFARTPPRGMTSQNLDFEDEDDGLQELQRDSQDRQRTRGEMQNQVTRADVNPATRQRMRELLASQNLENENLVSRFLSGEIANENAFNAEVERFEQENNSWERIFTTQREVRKKIQDLQHRTESYVELIPRGKTKFENLLRDVRRVNRSDDSTDRGLKRSLNTLINGDPARGVPANFISQKEANEIYSLDPTRDNFQRSMTKYRSRISRLPQGAVLFRELIGLKNEERRSEVQFNKLYNQVNNIIRQNLSKARNKADRETLLKKASKSVGITLQEGVAIKFSNPDILNLNGDTVKIQRITWNDVTVRDHNGNAVDKLPGVPYIKLTSGAPMPLGRFKKWVDAAGGVEKIESIDDLATKTGLAAYGLKVEKGMSLTYSRWSRNQQGQRVSTPTTVFIDDIKNGRIHFNEPVLFQPWIENDTEYDMRDSLTFGEFAKWWHRYEVEKSMGLSELRKMLTQYNEISNKEFGREANENPPILVLPDEELIYPDDPGATFKIIKLDPDGVVLDSGKKSFPEFFHWVRNNHVEKARKKQESPKDQAERLASENAAAQKKAEDKEEIEMTKHLGEEQQRRATENKQERDAGTIWGSVKKVWWETQILSLKDLWNMTKEIVEFVKRKHERRSKGRYGEVGSRLPGVLGTEFDRVRQAAENEEVNKYKEAMEHWGIPEVQHTLHSTNSKDEAKACIMTLVHKGEMRWDDPELWDTLNRLTSRYTLRGAQLYIPKPEYMPTGTSGEDLTRYAVDALWGEGTGAEWIGENTSKYNSQKNNFEYKFKQLENDPKQTNGPAGECKRMLNDWLHEGTYVNPQEYEEMIDAAIKYGKMTAEDKMFYIIAGVTAKKGGSPHGETLLHMDRIGELNSKYLNQFPMLDFFTQHRIYDYTIYDKKKKEFGVRRKLKLSDYEKWIRTEFPNDFRNCEPGPEFSRFMWEYILLDETVRTRMSKGVRHAENMDHDDAHIVIPLATPSEIDDLTTNAQGNMKKFTNEGYMNGLVGFGQYMMTLQYAIDDAKDQKNEEGVRTKTIALRDSINSFIRYDLILNNRLLKKDRDNRARLDDRHYQRTPVVDGSFTVGKHQEQLRNLMVAIGNEYGQNWSFLYDERYKTGSILDPEEARKQNEFEIKVDALKEKINELITSDSGEKALKVIRERIERSKTDPETADGLRGLPGSNRRPSREELAAIRAAGRAEEMAASHGGGH